MGNIRITLSALFIGSAVAIIPASAERPDAGHHPENELVGTWTMASAKYGGRAVEFPEGVVHKKHITPTEFMWITYSEDGQVLRAAGGDYSLEGDVYKEKPRYGIGEDFQVIQDKTQSFQCKVEGNTWYHTGKLSNGLTVEEVWKRTEKE